MTGAGSVEGLLRELSPQVLGALVRRHGRFDVCEDAVQEALLQASIDWPQRGVPEHPRGWLLSVATRRLIDWARSESAREQRETRFARGAAPAELARFSGEPPEAERDDSLLLLFLCCHPALSAPSQIALTLRAVGGLTTREIATAFFVPEATMAQRISRAKQTIRQAGATFSMPPPDQLEERTAAVRQVLYLIFNEGYTTPSVDRPTSVELTSEAIRLARQLHDVRRGDAETSGLLALLLLTAARQPARTSAAGELVGLSDQDRRLWDADLVREGIELITAALSEGPLGPYQLQAAIAAVHDEAPTVQETDWSEVLALYELLDRLAPNPMATINRAVAAAMVHGPMAGLSLLATVEDDPRVSDHHLLYAVRGHLLDMAGRRHAAAEAFRDAARRTSSPAVQRYLRERSRAVRASRPANSL